MTDQNGQSPAAQIGAAELDLIPAALSDAGKTADDLWRELDASENTQDDGAGKPAAETLADDFNDDTNTQTVVEPVVVPDKPAVAAQPDIWANATPEQRAAFEAVQAERDRLDHRIRSDSGRVSALQKRINMLRAAVHDQDGRAEQAKVSETLSPLKEHYPEIAEPLSKALEVMDGRFAEQERKEQGRKTAAQEELADTEAELANIIRAQETALAEVHPDWFDVLSKNGPAFQAWVEDQPRKVREAAYANAETIIDAKAASEVLDAFKAYLSPNTRPQPAPATLTIPETQPLNDRRQRQLAASASPRKPGSRPVVAGIPEDGDPADIWAAFDAAEAVA